MSAIVTTLTDNEIDPYSTDQENPMKQMLQNPEIAMSTFDIKNIIIFILVIIILFMMIGINIIEFMSNLIEYIADALKPVFGSILSAFAYLTGTTINTTTDVVSDTAKAGIDVVEDTIQSVGNLLIDVSNREDDKTEVSDKIEKSEKDEPTDEPEPDSSETSIQNSISNKKQSWCLVGDYNSRRSCASVNDAEKCMSGQIFPSHESCLNPNLITNVLPDKQRVTLVN
jgi:hypothetical protein